MQCGEVPFTLQISFSGETCWLAAATPCLPETLPHYSYRNILFTMHTFLVSSKCWSAVGMCVIQELFLFTNFSTTLPQVRLNGH